MALLSRGLASFYHFSFVCLRARAPARARGWLFLFLLFLFAVFSFLVCDVHCAYFAIFVDLKVLYLYLFVPISLILPTRVLLVSFSTQALSSASFSIFSVSRCLHSTPPV
jgi:hypothetical protein